MVEDGYLSSSPKERLVNIQVDRARILLQFEKTWRLKIHAVWLEAGDNNTKFFHRFANQRRISNSIWELKNQGGLVLSKEDFIKEEAVSYFQGIYRKEQRLYMEP